MLSEAASIVATELIQGEPDRGAYSTLIHIQIDYSSDVEVYPLSNTE